ncbi:hypothetical protein H2200_006471 [Cladophialophora chaetospira]|uniref:Uncharacterized protein n=1 Tax=Cladophialophora chaetospira TaxID=386627 RepID=A0AA39CHQ1_9EURO|nr:hypothetical protein H2200_006471 [Cladophialophora chaetospira]
MDPECSNCKMEAMNSPGNYTSILAAARTTREWKELKSRVLASSVHVPVETSGVCVKGVTGIPPTAIAELFVDPERGRPGAEDTVLDSTCTERIVDFTTVTKVVDSWLIVVENEVRLSVVSVEDNTVSAEADGLEFDCDSLEPAANEGCDDVAASLDCEVVDTAEESDALDAWDSEDSVGWEEDAVDCEELVSVLESDPVPEDDDAGVAPLVDVSLVVPENCPFEAEELLLLADGSPTKLEDVTDSEVKVDDTAAVELEVAEATEVDWPDKLEDAKDSEDEVNVSAAVGVEFDEVAEVESLVELDVVSRAVSEVLLAKAAELVVASEELDMFSELVTVLLGTESVLAEPETQTVVMKVSVSETMTVVSAKLGTTDTGADRDVVAELSGT